jgi:hypothetical protein
LPSGRIVPASRLSPDETPIRPPEQRTEIKQRLSIPEELDRPPAGESGDLSSARRQGQQQPKQVIASGGALAPGRSGIGTLNALANVTIEADGTFKVELAGADAYDTLAVDGRATITGGAIEVTLAEGYSPRSRTKHAIIRTTGGFNGTPSFTDITHGYAWAVDGNDIVLSVLPIGSAIIVR